jgi:hypothetical protein
MRDKGAYHGKKNQPKPVARRKTPFTEGEKKEKENKAKKKLCKGSHGTRNMSVSLMEDGKDGTKEAADDSKTHTKGRMIGEAKLRDDQDATRGSQKNSNPVTECYSVFLNETGQKNQVDTIGG